MNLLQRINKPVAVGLMGLLSACVSPKGWVQDSTKLNFKNMGGVELGNNDVPVYSFHVKNADDVRNVRIRYVNLSTGEIFDKTIDTDDLGKTKGDKGDLITILGLTPRGFEEGERWKELPLGLYSVRAYFTMDGKERLVDMTHYNKR